MARNEIQGMRELERTIRQLGQLPQRCVTKAARKGATIALRSAKQKVPVDSGDMKKGLVLKGEKLVKRGKKVYQVTFDKKMNHLFVKMSKDGNKRYYYPASQEYGYMTRGGGYVPGYRFLKESIENNAREIERTTVEVMTQEIDRLR